MEKKYFNFFLLSKCDQLTRNSHYKYISTTLNSSESNQSFVCFNENIQNAVKYAKPLIEIEEFILSKPSIEKIIIVI